MKTNHECYACDSANIKSYDLCRSTVAGYRCNEVNESLAQPFFDLILDYCTDCGMVSQRRYDGAGPLLNRLYEEHASTQHTRENPYFDDFAQKIVNKYGISSNKRILEIGCNCGLLLKKFRDFSGAKVYGVEPSRSMKEVWKNRDIMVFNGYLDSETEQAIRQQGPFNLIYFRHVFEHVPDPINFIKIAVGLLDTDGVIVLEVPYLKSIIDNKRIENVSYSHLHQYCIRSLDAIFKRFGLGLVDHSLEPTDGGSIVAHFRREAQTPDYLIESDIEAGLKNFIHFNSSLRATVQEVLHAYNPGELVGYGAGAKGQHLIHLLGLSSHLQNVVDDTPGFASMLIPGTKIEIVSRKILEEISVRAVINLAPTHSDTIRSKVPQRLHFIDFVNSDVLYA